MDTCTSMENNTPRTVHPGVAAFLNTTPDPLDNNPGIWNEVGRILHTETNPISQRILVADQLGVDTACAFFILYENFLRGPNAESAVASWNTAQR